MMGRLISWCVPDNALRLQAKSSTTDPDLTNVENVLRPYKEELEVGGYHAASIYTNNA
jgi:hypothetical protein